jgi:acetyl esterase
MVSDAPLDPQLQAMLDAARGLRAGAAPSVEEARQGWLLTTSMADTPAEDVAEVRDIEIDGPAQTLRLRSYRGADSPARPPILVWYHGGGWVLGGLETADRICRRIANRTGALVVSCSYRLAPEHPAPAAVDDAWAALQWVAANAGALGGDEDRIGVGGDSAGGNLAALMTLRAREAGGPTLAHQLLVYPALDLTRSAPSHRAMGDGLFDPDMVGEWYDRYLGGADATDVALSPAAATDLRGLPPAYVLTVGHDPLRDEGIDYVERLRHAGVPVEHQHEPTMLHGFIQLGAITPRAAVVTERMCAHLQSALGPRPRAGANQE